MNPAQDETPELGLRASITERPAMVRMGISGTQMLRPGEDDAEIDGSTIDSSTETWDDVVKRKR